MCQSRGEMEPSAGVLLVVQEPNEDDESIGMRLSTTLRLSTVSDLRLSINRFYSSTVVCIYDREYGNCVRVKHGYEAKSTASAYIASQY